jgi:cyclic pyranopterin phosphate synthase
MAHLDSFNRPISYLRISVTDRCNLRCTYCMPPGGVPLRSHRDILRYEEIETVVRAAAELGISKVRLTGGEPLVRPGVIDLVRMLAAVPRVDDLSMTSNGTLLRRHALDLAAAGLMRVNISLDTLRPERFRSITRQGALSDALAGIDAAHSAGLMPVKINVVVMAGVNDDEVTEFARKTRDAGWHVRFIELMPVGECSPVGDAWPDLVVAAAQIRDEIEAMYGPLEPVTAAVGGGPARYYRLPEADGTIGFITPVSDHFCTGCNRLRLTADGQLRLCLLSDFELDLRGPLREGAGVEDIKSLLLQGIRRKPMHHFLDDTRRPETRVMSEIGG